MSEKVDKNSRKDNASLVGGLIGIIIVLMGVLVAGVGYVVAKAKNFIGRK